MISGNAAIKKKLKPKFLKQDPGENNNGEVEEGAKSQKKRSRSNKQKQRIEIRDFNNEQSPDKSGVLSKLIPGDGDNDVS